MIPRARKFFFSTQKRRTYSLFLAVTIIFAIITTFYIGGKAFTSCNMDIVGAGPADGTAGLTWMTWLDHNDPIPGFTHMTNAPFGDELREPFQITSLYTIPAMWIFSRLTSAICSWNLMVFIGYMTSALAMFAFMRWLVRNICVAFFAAFAVTYTPYHQINALGHLSYMFNAFFTLFIWAFMAFWKRPSRRHATILAVSTAACAYMDGYFLLLEGVLAASILVGAFLVDAGLFKRPRPYILTRLKGLILYAIVLIILLVPALGVELFDGGTISSTLASQRSAITSEAAVYSARPFEYFVPAANSQFLPSSYGVWRQKVLHGSNFTESTLYLGAVVVLLALFAWIWLIRNRKKEQLTFQGLKLPFIVSSVSFALLVAFLCSLEPVVHLDGHKIPMPSWFIIHVTAFWRVFARLYLVVDTCIVIVAAIGLYLLIRNWSKRKQAIVTLIIVLLTGADMLTHSHAAVWNYNSSPAVYSWLKTQSNVHIIAEYPLGEPPSQAITNYTTYQQVSDKAIFNTSLSNSPQRPLHLSMLGLEDTQTLPILRTEGVNLVLAHNSPVPNPGALGLQLLRVDASTSPYDKDKVWTYKLLPGPTASYALIASQGFHAPVLDSTQLLHSKIGMGSLGVLVFQKLTPGPLDSMVHVTLGAHSEQGPQLVTFAQNGVVRWQGTVSGNTSISFNADPSIAVDIIPYNPTASETMQIYNLSATN
jgi:hypothetical protein